MCNPRRIRVTATRQLNQAWQREITRRVELTQQVTGEARVRQNLNNTLGKPALRALKAILANSDSGWIEVDEGYRYDIEGGYILYLVDEQALEIVAVLADEVQATGEGTQVLSGVVQAKLAADGEGSYYDDGWGGRDQAFGERQAQTAAEQQLDAAAQTHLQQAQTEAEVEAEEGVMAQARAQAQTQLAQEASERQTALAEQARQHLETVGLRGRQVFNRYLGQAYKDAILAYARVNGADQIQCQEEGDVIEIEFNLHR